MGVWTVFREVSPLPSPPNKTLGVRLSAFYGFFLGGSGGAHATFTTTLTPSAPAILYRLDKLCGSIGRSIHS